MGSNISHAAAAPSVPAPPPITPPGLSTPSGLLPPPPAVESPKTEKIDYLNLPSPIKYEEIQREIMFSLKPELFEGMRFDFNKPLNQQFSLSHSLLMGSMEVPQQNPTQILKIPNATYEFGANLINPRMFLIGRFLTDGRMNARANYQLNDRITLKANAQLTNEPHFSHLISNIDYKGSDFHTQLTFGNNAFYGINYIQSITPTLSFGAEGFWLGQQRRSGLGFATRYDNGKSIATAQIATTGLVTMGYVQKVSERVSLASEFVYNAGSRDVTSTVGYDYILRQCRLRGKIDTNGVVGALLEERLNLGVSMLFSAEIDHYKKDYKFGFGMTVGE